MQNFGLNKNFRKKFCGAKIGGMHATEMSCKELQSELFRVKSYLSFFN